MPRPFALTARLLAEHGFASRALALPPTALGMLVQLLASRPEGSTPWALQGRRADAQVWAPLVERKRQRQARSGPSCEACGGSGKCAQCEGIGCSVCESSGKCSVCEGSGAIEASREEDEEDEDSSSSPAAGAVVRVVSVRGVLASEVTEWTCGVMDGYQGRGGVVDRWRQAHADPSAAAVVLDAMAPGGDALLCLESAAELAAITAASPKPSLVFATEATSAMYALACGAASPGGLFVAPSANLANVGTRMWHVDRSKANEIAGEKVTHIGSPAGKILGNPDEPLDPKALERFSRDIDESTARFVAFVSERRGLSAEQVRGLDADTRRGQVAVDERLADGTAQNLAEVVALAYARAVAPSASTFSPAPTSGASPSPPEDDMKLSPAALHALGLASGASSAAIEAAILSARPLEAVLDTRTDPVRALGEVTLEALGTRDPLAALVDAPRLLARGKAAPEREAENDALRREAAWSAAITAGAFRAGEVWRQVEVQGPGGKTARDKAYTPMAAAWNAAYPDVAQLEQRLDGLPKLARASDANQADATLANRAEAARRVPDSMSAATAALARKAGVDPAQLAENTAILFAHFAPGA